MIFVRGWGAIPPLIIFRAILSLVKVIIRILKNREIQDYMDNI